MDPGFRRGDEWQHAITFGKHYISIKTQASAHICESVFSHFAIKSASADPH